MCLSTVMRLMVEEMHQDISEDLRLRHSRGSLIAVQTSQRRIVVFFDYGYEPFILCNTCSGQFTRPLERPPIGEMLIGGQPTDAFCEERVG